jgi:hypothetical protein
LAAVAVAIVAATAQAASNKPYTANVHQTLNTSGSFTLTLTNDPKASQSLGSANFTAPPGFTLGVVTGKGGAGASGFDANVVGNVVQFRAKSSSQALAKGQTVSADVTVTGGISGCGSATWTVEAKQSNDFSGQPGNDMTLNPASDLTPLGSFAWNPIGTQIGDVFAPAILTGTNSNETVDALDTCGALKTASQSPFDTAYNGPTTLAYDGHQATVSGLTWSSGVGTASIKPTVSETSRTLTLTDIQTGISAQSDPFDTQDKICTSVDTSCVWHNGNNSINANANGPATGSLGVGFDPAANVNFVCNGPGAPLGGTVITISPHDTPAGSYLVTLVYSKQLSGTGSANAFSFCESTDNGATFTQLLSCADTDPGLHDCVSDQKRVIGGALQVILSLLPGDPYVGGK